MNELDARAASRARHPSNWRAPPPGMVVLAPGVSDRDRSYAIATVARLRRLSAVPGERVTIVLCTGVHGDAQVLVRFEGAAGRLAHHASGRTFLEAIDRLESSVRRSLS